MSRPRPKISASRLNRPTPDTKFHIDFDWWEESDLDLKTFLFSRLDFGDDKSPEMDVEKVDLVDPDTAEIRVIDGFQFALQTYFNQLPDDFAKNTSLVDAVFYVLLANTNEPMTARDLADRVGREPEVLLKTLAGHRIYQGIRPIFEEDD